MTTSAPSAASQPFAGLTDPKEWARAILPALVFGLAAFGGIELTRFGGRIAAIWPANGILLAVLMLGRPRGI